MTLDLDPATVECLTQLLARIEAAKSEQWYTPGPSGGSSLDDRGRRQDPLSVSVKDLPRKMLARDSATREALDDLNAVLWKRRTALEVANRRLNGVAVPDKVALTVDVVSVVKVHASAHGSFGVDHDVRACHEACDNALRFWPEYEARMGVQTGHAIYCG